MFKLMEMIIAILIINLGLVIEVRGDCDCQSDN